MMVHFWRKERSDESSTARLLEAMNIESKDIEINRGGDISPLQKHSLHRDFLDMGAGFIVLSLFAGVWVHIIFQRAPTVPLILFSLFVGAIIVRLSYRHYKRVSTGHATAFTGRVKKYSEQRGCFLVVVNYHDKTERIYDVDRTVYNALVEGETYTIYSPSYWDKKIISAEHHPA